MKKFLRIFHIFKLQREERLLAGVVFVIFAVLNAALVSRYGETFMGNLDGDLKLFIRHFQVSGFDPLTYSVLTNWSTSYNVYRHPLLAFFMWPGWLLNQGLMTLTGYNFALPIAVVMQIFCACYAVVFLRRIFREVVELERWASEALTLLFVGFAFVMVTAIVPDHFVISMFLLILALYVSGRRMKNRHPFKIWQSVVYFLLTAGVSLNNGLKIYLSALFVNGKKFFRPTHLLLAVILPAGLLWGFCRWEYRHYVWPQEMARKAEKAKKNAEKKERQERMAYLQHVKDSLLQDSLQRGLKFIPATELAQKAKDDSTRKARREARRKIKAGKQGKPMMKGEFMGWTDATTSRWQTLVENMFGEGIQLHQDFLLVDELRGDNNRTIVVNYRHWWNYAVEAIIVWLFLCGIWAGRRSRFLWLTLSYFALDMLLHIGLGFGINEVYIMTAHWIYALPIAIAYLLHSMNDKKVYRPCLALVSLIALYLLIYNGSLIVGYFVG